MRVLRQNPFECVVSFILSSCNNIGRIGMLVRALRKTYGGPPVCELPAVPAVGGAPAAAALTLYAWPSLPALATASEEALRGLGLGYRGKFLSRTTAKLTALGGEAWLLGLRGAPDYQTHLTSLDGVGRKVADCVALFSLDAVGAIPVDTHVAQIAQRDFGVALQGKSLTPKLYEVVGEAFRSRYGSHAGWAHCWLFAGELPVFRPYLVAAGVPVPVKVTVKKERKTGEEGKGAGTKRKAAKVKAEGEGAPSVKARGRPKVKAEAEPPVAAPVEVAQVRAGGGKRGKKVKVEA